MRKLLGFIILIAAIVMTLTFWVNESLIGKLISLMVGIMGIFEGKQLIQDKK
ncbi:hypothetical protein H9L25_00380 [Terrisporobacter mayombei]|nr:hypothetical protein [Terrisporobacter mayombei]